MSPAIPSVEPHPGSQLEHVLRFLSFERRRLLCQVCDGEGRQGTPRKQGEAAPTSSPMPSVVAPSLWETGDPGNG